MTNSNLNDSTLVIKKHFLKRLSELRSLKQNWDGEGAERPSDDVLDTVLRGLDEWSILPDDIDPDVIGGIALWFHSKQGAHPDVAVMIGLRNNGKTVVCKYDEYDIIPQVTFVQDSTSAMNEANQFFLQQRCDV